MVDNEKIEILKRKNKYVVVVPDLEHLLIKNIHGVVVDYLQDDLKLVKQLLGPSEQLTEDYYYSELMKIEKKLQYLDSDDPGVREKLKEFLRGVKPETSTYWGEAHRDLLLEAWVKLIAMGEKYRKYWYEVLRKESCSHYLFECDNDRKTSFLSVLNGIKIEKINEFEQNYSKILLAIAEKQEITDEDIWLFKYTLMINPAAINCYGIGSQYGSKNPYMLSTPLTQAVHSGNFILVDFLLAQPNIKVNQSELFNSFFDEPNITADQIEQLKVRQDNLNTHTPLVLASKYGYTHITGALLRHPDIDAYLSSELSCGIPVLTRPSLRGNSECVQFLLNNLKFNKREIEAAISAAESGKKMEKEICNRQLKCDEYNKVIGLLKKYQKEKLLLMKFGRYSPDFFKDKKKKNPDTFFTVSLEPEVADIKWVESEPLGEKNSNFPNLIKLSSDNFRESEGIINVEMPKELDTNERESLLKEIKELLALSDSFYSSKIARTVSQIYDDKEDVSRMTKLVITGITLDNLTRLIEYVRPSVPTYY